MLQKGVPVIFPLHEVANSAAVVAIAEEGIGNRTTGAEKITPPALTPVPKAVPAVAAGSVAISPIGNKVTGEKPPVGEQVGMRPLRKNKRLRPVILKRDNNDDSDEFISRIKVSKLKHNQKRAAPNRTAINGRKEEEVGKEVGKEVGNERVVKGRGRRGERDVSSSLGSEVRRSAVCSPASSGLGGNDDVSTEALLKVVTVAAQENIYWTKIKGHPYWPAQFVRMSADIELQDKFKKASKFRRKGEDTCVMYFGTCQVAYVNSEKSCISWEQGLRKNMHRSHKNRSVFQSSLAEVKAYCHRNTKYPRGWWCEPEVMIQAHDFFDKCVGTGVNKKLKVFISRAHDELVHWARMRGYPPWPVQLLPRNMAKEAYPALKLSSENDATTTNFPCMFFGTGEVAVVPEKHLAPFGAGLARGYGHASERHDFAVAVGEVWGYLQEPRVWPSGYMSGVEWWNYEEPQEFATKMVEDEGDVRVPHLPQYVHVRKSVWAATVEPPPKPKKGEVGCCDCTPTVGEACCADSNCLNFASHYFCSPSTCKGASQCTNINFHKRKSPRMKPFFTADQRGWGLRVEEMVKSGSFVIEYVGEIINRDILDERLKKTQQLKSNEYYMMDLTNDLLVDAKFKGNLSRFINSSCEPNCQTEKWTDSVTGQTHVGIFAIQDIPVGTELTYNYCFEDFGLSGKSGTRSFMCQCGTSSCSMLEPIERKLMKKLIGKRLEVRWDDGWYPGVVELYNLKKKRFRVQYDDGDCEDLLLGSPLDEDDGVAFRLVEDNARSRTGGKQ